MSRSQDGSAGMSAARLTAYSDGVIAIIVTIMVLDLHAPMSSDPHRLISLWPVFSAYVLSFLLVSIYWVNHHHLLHANHRIGREVLWFNLLWLFFLSLFPFATAYVSATKAAPIATALYAGLGTLTGVAFLMLGSSLSRRNADVDIVSRVSGDRLRKNVIAIAINAAAAGLAFIWLPAALLCLTLPAIAYFLPDQRVEQA